MRFSTRLLTAAAAAGFATFAAAQDAEAPADAPAAQAEDERPRLTDLDATVNALLDDDAEPAGPAEADAAQAPPDEADAEAAAEAGPELAATNADQPEAETAPAEPAPSATPPPPLGRAALAELEHAAQRGRLLIAIARAGIIATQDMLSRVSDPEGAGIEGWIAEPAGNATRVTFYTGGEGGPSAVYRADVNGGRVVAREVFLTGDRPALNPVQARMAAARAAASALDHRPCGGDQFNYLVVPPADADAPVAVYQITPQSERGRFPIGGHFRTLVAADGSVTEARGFANACLVVEAAAPAAGAQARPVAVTHLLDPLPTEVHVLTSALIGAPLVVVAGDPQRVFAVTPERIAEVRR